MFRAKQGRSRILDEYRDRSDLKIPPRPSLLRPIPRVRGRYHRLRAPRTFSFIDNPNGTIDFLNSLIGESMAGTKALYIDQSGHERLDLCAGTVLNAVAFEARNNIGTRFAGRYPQSEALATMVVAAGLPALFDLTDVTLPNVETFEVRKGTRINADGSASSNLEDIGHSLVSYIRRCFARHRRSLSGDDLSRLGKIIGEVLANANEYGDGVWWVSGFMRTDDDNPVGECHLSFLNFGTSVAQSLQTLPPGPLRSEIEGLVRTHESRRLFLPDGPWSEEALWTLYALQEFVTCHHETRGKIRGLGTADIFSAFQELGRTIDQSVTPRMCLVSGTTHFLFDGRFPMDKDARGRRVLALNSTNDLGRPPETGVVTRLERPFPGTLLSLHFFLDSRFT
jgi:hypothetical protein